MQQRSSITTKLRAMDWIDNTDLRGVTAKRTFLLDTATRYALRDGQFVIFSNKTFDRARLVMKLGPMPMLVILPTEERSKNLSLQLRINELIYAMYSASREAKPKIAAAVERSQQRLERAQRRAAAQKLPPPALLDW